MKIQLSTGSELSINTGELEKGIKDYERLLHTIITENIKKFDSAELTVEQLLLITREAVWEEIDHIVDNEIQDHATFLRYLMIFACTREYYNLLKQVSH